MSTATAHVPTANASRYLQQLCKHWSHKLDVAFDERAGTVRFQDAVVSMSASEQGLSVTVEATNEEIRDRIEGVVQSHLDRFAFREAPLPFQWS
ncbi:DUF2218 domain-containing protein [Aquibium sp. LZ166]|uniref:DUF2218 domain-containing protein n=1 Tax=Aquibium pacificus TaxID=3153579 RepID=A0ABV3SCQ0_9HYPH